jgi:hypothetical protein
MLFRLLPRLLCAVFCIAAASAAFSQTVYDADRGRLNLAIGGGISNFDPDVAQGPPPANGLLQGWGQGRMWGATAWVDAGIPRGAPWLRGFGIEAEYRSILEGGSTGQSSLRESTIGGGAMYTWRHWNSVHPYGKYLFALGSVSFAAVPEANGTLYSQDSRGANIVGGGGEFRLTQHIWGRAEYDYTSWGELLGPHLQPQGFTVGAVYHIRGFSRP